MSFWELLNAWFKEKFGQYDILRIKTVTSTTGEPRTYLECIPCMGYIEIIWHQNQALKFQDKVYRPADPSFTFEEVFSGVILNHLYHHAKGPLYTERWKAQGNPW